MIPEINPKVNQADREKLLGLITQDMVDNAKTEWSFREILSLIQDSEERFEDWKGCWDGLVSDSEVLATPSGNFKLREGETIWQENLLDPGIRAMEEAILMIHNICTQFLPPLKNAIGDLSERVHQLTLQYEQIIKSLEKEGDENEQATNQQE